MASIAADRRETTRLSAGVAPAFLLTAALAYAVVARGAQSGGDHLVVFALIAVAAAPSVGDGAARAGLRSARALLPLVVWMLVVGRADGQLAEATTQIVVIGIGIGAFSIARGQSDDERDHTIRLLGHLLTAVAAVSLLLFLMRVRPVAMNPGNGWRNGGLVTYPNAFGILVLVGVAAKMHCLTGAARARRIADSSTSAVLDRAAIVVLVLAGLTTGSRLTLALLGGAALAFAWRSAASRTTRSMRDRTTGVGTAVAALTAAVGAAAFGLALMTAAERTRIMGFPRLALWERAWSIIAANPITGLGPGKANFEIDIAVPSRTSYAHNEALQIAVEFGVVGLALALIGAVLMLRGGRLRAERPPALIAIVGFVVAFAAVDFAARLPVLVIPLALAVGWLTESRRKAATTSR